MQCTWLRPERSAPRAYVSGVVSQSSSSSVGNGGGMPGWKRVWMEKAIGEIFASTSHRKTAEDDDEDEKDSEKTLKGLF
jgi:hypothetical protein